MQRTTEWLEEAEVLEGYFERQFAQPFRSTIRFCDWLEGHGCLSASYEVRIADIGAGMGQTLAYMARRFPRAQCTGIELNARHVERGNQRLRELGVANARLVNGDLYRLDPEHQRQYDGIISLQTLSWLPGFEEPLTRIVELGPRWIALTSLFFDGPVSAKIEIQDFARPGKRTPYREEFYNVYAIPLVRQFLAERGFEEFDYEPFRIDVELPKPTSPGMGTYTVRLDTGESLQISGPLLMTWGFVLARTRSRG